MLRRRPALRFALFFIGGILLGEVSDIAFTEMFFVLLGCSFVAGLLQFRFRTSLPSSFLIQITILMLGWTLFAYEEQEILRRQVAWDEWTDTLSVDGTIEESATSGSKSARIIVSTESIRRGSARRHMQRRVIVLVPPKLLPSVAGRKAGTRITIRGIPEEFPRPRNPGEFDYGRYLRLNEIDGIVRATEDIRLKDDIVQSLPIKTWFHLLREQCADVLNELHGPAQASFLRGILLGDRRDIPFETKESFVNTGTIHVLAVSGAHVAVIALALYTSLRLLRLSKRWVIILSIGGLLFYMMLTGSSASVSRATIMACIIFVSQLIERRTDIYNSLSVAALALLLYSPHQLLNVGFQLSFAAVVSIVSLYPALVKVVQKLPSWLLGIKSIDYLFKLFAVSLAAQLGTLPFTAYYFERISIVSLGANLVVVPLIGLNLMIGCVTLISSVVSHWISITYAALNDIVISFLLQFVDAAAAAPYAYVETAGFTLLYGVIYYIVLGGIFNIHKPVRVKTLGGILFSFLTMILLFEVFTTPSNRVLKVTAIDVGQGDAVLVQFPGGQTMLVDAGPSQPGYDVGERIVVPFLHRQGMHSIDIVVFSHPHTDHIGGMPSVFDKCDVGVVYEADTTTASGFHERLKQKVDGMGIRRALITAGMEISPDLTARVYCIHPNGRSDDFENLNNKSVGLKIVYGSTSILLPGDAEKDAEDRMIRRYGSFLDADILKAGHHGSSTSSSQVFLDGITPDFAIISVGKWNKFGHPSPDRMQEMARRDIIALRTDQKGAVMFESDGHRWKHIQWRTED